MEVWLGMVVVLNTSVRAAWVDAPSAFSRLRVGKAPSSHMGSMNRIAKPSMLTITTRVILCFFSDGRATVLASGAPRATGISGEATRLLPVQADKSNNNGTNEHGVLPNIFIDMG